MNTSCKLAGYIDTGEPEEHLRQWYTYPGSFFIFIPCFISLFHFSCSG